MTSGTRTSQTFLVLGFLAVLFGVPISQVAVEISHGGPVQCTDLFRGAPTVKNLRQYEQTLEDKWWGQATVRPRMQDFLFFVAGDTGAKAIAGRGGWMFYRPGVQYLTQASRTRSDGAESSRAKPSIKATGHSSVVRAITQYRDQLKQRGIELVVVPVPGKASVYPEMLTRRLAGQQLEFQSPTEDLLAELGQHAVETVDLFTAFREARRNAPLLPSNRAYYLRQDTHWTPAGARVAARAVAEKLRELGWTFEHPWEYASEAANVARRGDVLEMMQLPGVSESFQPEIVECERVLDQMTGPLVPQPGGRDGVFKNDHLIDTPLESSLLLLGDSFCRIYQFAEPGSLGDLAERLPSEVAEGNAGARQEGAQHRHKKKRLLPGSAGFPSLLAQLLKAPVDYLISDGGAATDVRQRLSVDSEILENKKVVIWEFAERDIHLGLEGWQEVPLPPE